MATEAITKASQYLTFGLSSEVFAVEVAKVREILDYTTITKVPRTPEFMRGVINVRGSVVPVVDLRLKFGMTRTEWTLGTCIIVLEIAVEGETIVLGALADSVREVIEMEPDQIEPAPRIGVRVRNEFIRGMGKTDSGFIMILDIDSLFSADELDMVADTGDGELSMGQARAV
jgi:purine-binding chemotaxis protein CheW